MTKLKLQITMSLDGYVAGPDQGVDHPLGVGGERLHGWAFATRTFCEMLGIDGGATGPDNDMAAEIFHNVGATIMGRNMFGGGGGPWDASWLGWWGDNPPYHTPVFVLTHHPREPLEMLGGTTFHFVTEGIHAALHHAKQVAHGKDVSLGGGAKVVQQYLAAGLIDEMDVHVVPLMLGRGERLFEDTGGRQTGYECVRVLSSPAVTHFRYHRVK